MKREREAIELDYERRFRRAGVPLFDESFTAGTNIFNRAAPLLVLLFFAELFGAINLDWSPWANLAALAGGIAVLVLAAALVNRARGRPALSVPEQLGKTELAAFVLIPALLPLIFGGQIESVVWTIAGNVGVLALIWAVLGVGLPSIVSWVFRHLLSQLLHSFALLARAVPLLMVFILLSFTTTEMWQLFHEMSRFQVALIAVLFTALGIAFLIARVPLEVRRLEAEAGQGMPPLRTRQRVNVGLVLLVGQAVQILLVTLLVTVFLLLVGMIAVTETIRESWMGDPGTVWLSFTLAGDEFAITQELVRVAAGLASFSGLYFAVAMLTDATYREEFLDEVTAGLKAAFHARSEYLRLRAGAAGQNPTA